MTTTRLPVVKFHQVDPRGGVVKAGLGDGYVMPTVAGGWTTVSRPRQVNMVEWTGRDAITMDIPIIFDAWREGHSQESLIGRLYTMMMRRVGPRFEPAVVTVSGAIPVPFNSRRWTINNIQPGDEIRRNIDGHRVRATFTVSLLEYVPGDVVIHHKTSPAKKKNHQNSQAGNVNHTRVYIVKSGDTLSKIAAKVLHKASRWHEIAKLNNIRDPNSIKVGQRLKVPQS